MKVSIPMEQRALAERHNGHELALLIAALDASSTDECVDCGMKLGGLMGMFQWGFVHGLGECSRCGFPYAYYHYHEVSPTIPVPMRCPRRAEELLLMAFVPNADIPLGDAKEIAANQGHRYG